MVKISVWKFTSVFLMVLLLLFGGVVYGTSLKKPQATMHCSDTEEFGRARAVCVHQSSGKNVTESDRVVAKPEVKYPVPFAFLYYGRKTDPDGHQWLKSDLAPLKECGIEPEIIDDLTGEDLAKRLKEKGLDSDGVFLLSAHGSPVKPLSSLSLNGVNSLQVGPKKVRGGPDIYNYLGSRADIWVGTCHADSFRPEIGSGAECMKNETAPVALKAWPMLAKLYCDDYKGDCSLWDSVDTNNNGILEPYELTAYLRVDQGMVSDRIYLNTLGLFSYHTELERIRTRYHGLKDLSISPIKTISGESTTWRVYYDKPEKKYASAGRGFQRRNPYHFVIGKFASFNEAEKAAKQRFPEWPKSCVIYGRKLKNCRLGAASKSYVDVKWRLDGIYAPLSYVPHPEKRRNYIHPIVNHLAIYSRRCERVLKERKADSKSK